MMMFDGASEHGKSFKQMMQEFELIRVKVFIRQEKSEDILANLEKIKSTLLESLEFKKIQSRVEIEKAEMKKSNLIKRLVLLEKAKDTVAQDQIIKELEEYSRIRRYRDAQLVKITKEIADINLTENQYKDKMERKDKEQFRNDDSPICN